MRFIGRTAELYELTSLIEAVARGRGGAVCIQSVAGMGRTRLLEEIGMRAQRAGAKVVYADASMYRQRYGTTRALVLRLCEAEPDLARRYGGRYRSTLVALGPEIAAQFVSPPSPAPYPSAPAGQAPKEVTSCLEEWFGEISSVKPLVILVDNVEYADNASIGLLASLAKMSAERPLLLVVTERIARETRDAFSLVTLRHYSIHMELTSLKASETLELLRSLFADAPSVERFAEWLHERTAGSPLYAVELCRQLAAKQVIRYSDGVWTLPIERPDSVLPPSLGEVLSIRIAALSEQARALAECLSLQREQPTLELCGLLSDNLSHHPLLHLLDELASKDVLYPDRDGYRLGSTALREALLSGMDGTRLERNHRRIGEAFVKLAGEGNPALRVEAGWHLIQGDDETRGAEIIADVTRDTAVLGTLVANLDGCGQFVEAALKVFNRHRRSTYERLPLLNALAHAGYYEDRYWDERYGDQALDVAEEISGLATARRLRPFLGRAFAFGVGMFGALLRFHVVARRERRLSFRQVFTHLFGIVTALTGAASLQLDLQRASRIARTLEPFAVLPERWTPVGIYQFCRGLQHVGNENQVAAYETFETLARRFEDPGYYRSLPADARNLYIVGAHFARASFAIFRAHGEAALESADKLDKIGLKLYAMIASELRFLYYTFRGEFAKAAPHHEQVELHAARVGSLWQVETWEAASLFLVYLNGLSDIVAATRLVHRLELISRTVPTLKRYSRLAQQALMLTRREAGLADKVAAQFEFMVPRGYIGWAATITGLARGYNQQNHHAEAKVACERALQYTTDKDREHVAFFLGLDIELAIAKAGLGQAAEALALLDGLIERFADCDHPLLHGLLHEARARIAWGAGMTGQYAISLAVVESCFRPSGAAVLIERYDELSRLGAADATLNPLIPTSVRPPEYFTVDDALAEYHNGTRSRKSNRPPSR
jgi:hypothetical protein